MNTFEVWIIEKLDKPDAKVFFRSRRRAEHFVEENPDCLIAAITTCTEDAWQALLTREAGEYAVH